MIYHIGLPKDYIECHSVPPYEDFYETVTIQAKNSIEAANIAWEYKKDEWLPLFSPQREQKQIVYLFVSKNCNPIINGKRIKVNIMEKAR